MAIYDSGKMLKRRAIRQKSMHNRKKVKLICVYLSVKTPMPMYRNTKYSLRTAMLLKMLCAVICDVGERLYRL